VFAWGTLSARLERFDVTAPITFVLAGVLLTHGPLSPLGFQPSHETVKTLAEITLVLVLFVGWFGPRGLASVVFALIALEDLDQRVAGPVVTVIAVTVLFSVVAHGATADPLARRCGPRVAQAAGGSVDPSDDLGTPPLPERRLIRRASPIRHAS